MRLILTTLAAAALMACSGQKYTANEAAAAQDTLTYDTDYAQAQASTQKQTANPRRPTNVLTVFYDSGVGSAPLDAVLGSTQGCEVLQRDAETCSVTIRLNSGDARTAIEDTKGVLSVTEHQVMQH